MNKKAILALAGLAMALLSAVLISGLSSSISTPAQSHQSNRNGNTPATIADNNNNLTTNEIK